MRRTYGFLILAILALLVGPTIFLKNLQLKWLKLVELVSPEKRENYLKTTYEELSLENQILKSQISYIREWIAAQQKVEEFFSEMKKLEKTEKLMLVNQESQKKRFKILADYVNLFSRHAFAKIILKEPFSSSSFAWVNVGELYNQKIGYQLVQKNSPVVVGDVLVGVVEEVFLHHAKIRLITDPNLVIAVKSARGKSQLKVMNEKALELLDTLELVEDFGWEKKQELKDLIAELHVNLDREGQDRFYAVGEVYGAEYSPFFAFHNSLVGEGFHFQAKSKESTGFSNMEGFKEIVIKKGDLLETTGLDGIFPEGLKVAIVTDTSTSKFGRLTYEIKAKSLIANIHEIEYVQILPPAIDLSF
jgi:cell shape-determining protein MreC